MLEGRCDLCLQKDGFKGHNLQECKSCGVKVHETCYGLPWTKTKRTDFECAACAYAENGARERPTECQLCSVSDGVHAMHPLYDRDGPEGKPVLVSSGKDGATRRPAFVHTLCGMYLASWAGVVYGCDVDGNFEGGDDEDDDDQEEETEEETEEENPFKEGANPTNKATPPAQSTDAGSASEDKEKDANVSSSTKTDGTNKENGKEEKKDDEKKDEEKDDDDDDDDDKTAELMSTHHFVICGREKGKETAWTRHTKELRDNVKCKICGKSDKKAGILRIPMQCSWGDKNELKEFKERRPKSAASEVCNEGMHVGCARWGRAGRLDGQPSLPKQVFFYAGQAPEKDGGTFTDPVSNAYCRRHAQLLHENRPRAAGDGGATTAAAAAEKSRGKTSATTTTTTTTTPAAASVLEALPTTTCLATPAVVVDKDKEEADRKREARRSELAARQRRQLAQIEAKKRREQEQRDRDLDDRRRQEQKKKEFESRKRALVSKMSAELKRILLDLLAKRSERKVIVEAKRSCRMRWSKEANFSMDTFKTLWSKVEDIVQDATVKEVEAWRKNKAAVSKETRTAVALAAAARSKMVATKPAASAAEQPKRPVETKSKPKSQAVAPAIAVTVAAEKPVDKDDEVEAEAEAEAESEAAKKKEETPWDYLWIPNYNGVGFKFDKWDTYEQIDTI